MRKGVKAVAELADMLGCKMHIHGSVIVGSFSLLRNISFPLKMKIEGMIVDSYVDEGCAQAWVRVSVIGEVSLLLFYDDDAKVGFAAIIPTTVTPPKYDPESYPTQDAFLNSFQPVRVYRIDKLNKQPKWEIYDSSLGK